MSVGYGVFSRILKALLGLTLMAGMARADEVTILALGDSLTAGYGLNQADGFVPQLERWLTAQGDDIRIINAGVSGDTTAGGAARLNWALSDDVDAVLVALGGNDMLRGIAPEATYDNLDRILTALSARGLPTLLIGMPGPGNFGPDYKTAFEQVFPDLAAKHTVAYYPNFLAGLTSISKTTHDTLKYMQDDGLHPTPAGVTLIVEAIGPSVQKILPK